MGRHKRNRCPWTNTEILVRAITHFSCIICNDFHIDKGNLKRDHSECIKNEKYEQRKCTCDKCIDECIGNCINKNNPDQREIIKDKIRCFCHKKVY